MKSSRNGIRRGSNAVEFALLLPVFTVLLGAVLDYGYYFYINQAVNVAVRNGVRMAVADKTLLTQVQRTAKASDHAESSLAEYNISCTSLCTFTGSKDLTINYASDTFTAYRLQLQRPYSPMIGMVPVPTINGASYTMRVEN